MFTDSRTEIFKAIKEINSLEIKAYSNPGTMSFLVYSLPEGSIKRRFPKKG